MVDATTESGSGQVSWSRSRRAAMAV